MLSAKLCFFGKTAPVYVVKIRQCQLETATEPPMKHVNGTSENPESDFRLIEEKDVISHGDFPHAGRCPGNEAVI